MKLVMFRGGGGPGNPKYASVTRLLECAARDRGYTSVDSSLVWPGQDHQGVLTLHGALEVASRKIEELETGSEKYDLLARSFGCYVAVKIALDKQPKLLNKIMLWGPPPYWLMWEMWCRDIETNKNVASEKGLQVDSTLFPTLVPLESMLPEMRYEAVVATGDQDPYVSHGFLRYLETIVKERKSGEHCQSIRFKEGVPGAVHEVTEHAPRPVIEAYFKALFE